MSEPLVFSWDETGTRDRLGFAGDRSREPAHVVRHPDAFVPDPVGIKERQKPPRPAKVIAVSNLVASAESHGRGIDRSGTSSPFMKSGSAWTDSALALAQSRPINVSRATPHMNASM